MFRKRFDGTAVTGLRIVNQVFCLVHTCTGLGNGEFVDGKGTVRCEHRRGPQTSTFAPDRLLPQTRPYEVRVMMRLFFKLFIHGAGFQSLTMVAIWSSATSPVRRARGSHCVVRAMFVSGRAFIGKTHRFRFVRRITTVVMPAGSRSLTLTRRSCCLRGINVDIS